MKKRLLCPNLPKPGAPVVLSESEAHHATRVLRFRDGEVIEALDGNGHKALTTLRLREGTARLEFIETPEKPGPLASPLPQSPLSPRIENISLPIILEMSVLKGDAMEWVVEKAVELGVKQLIPVLTSHTVIQMKSKGPEVFRDRWQKIADQSLKQCGRLTSMVISLPVTFEGLLTETVQDRQSIRLWCDETGIDDSPYLMTWLRTTPHLQTPLIRILIGPEGGWSSLERSRLIEDSHTRSSQRIGLGPLILRAETAAIFAISLTSAQVRSSS